MAAASVALPVRAVRSVVRVGRAQGASEVLRRAVRVLGDRVGAWAPDDDFDPADIVDSSRVSRAVPARPVPRSRRLRVGFVTTPPVVGSGGHTTMFRLVSALEEAGHECVLFLYDRFHGDLESQTADLRRGWPWMRAEVRRAADGITGVDAAVASGWQTAHVLARATSPMHRLYLVQDYEPFFYPRGSTYALAEDTYRFGFHHVAVGEMVGTHLRRLGVPVDVVPFGCDTGVYHLAQPPARRRGVVFYVRPGADRRGFALARLALTEFHRRCPDEPVHVYGEAGRVDLPFPVVNHGRLTPAQLNDLYNGAVAGLALSFTNISLVVSEMLAAGLVPVVNDAPDSRADVRPEAAVAWAAPTPSAIAERLVDLVGSTDEDRPVRVAASVVADEWRPARDRFVGIVEEVLYHSSSAERT